MTVEIISEPDKDDVVEVSMTFADAMRIARTSIADGLVDWQEGFYREVLARDPDHAEALHYLGVVLHQQNRIAEGTGFIEASLKAEPDNSGFWNNYGLILSADNRYDDAIDAFRRGIELNADNASAYSNLGLVHMLRRRQDIAEACFTKALEIDDGHVAAYENLASLCIGQGRLQDALKYAYIAVTKDPEKSRSRQRLAFAYAELGMTEKAHDVYREWLKTNPDDVIALHHYKALTGETVERASDAYVQQIFDAFANSFDAKLGQLEYRAPELIIGLLASTLGTPNGDLRIADLGCGTGLCGPGARPFAAELIGVDLSEKMLAKANARGCYDACLQEELTRFCNRHPAGFDALICADTLCYIGNLRPVFAAAAKAMRPNGIFIFTVELAAEGTKSFLLHHHGRYSHAEAYVRESLQFYRLQVESLNHRTLRMESGRPVHGLVVQVRV